MASARGSVLLLALFVIFGCDSLPVDRITTEAPAPQHNKTGEEWDSGLEYDRYLKEVVQILEDDPEFKRKLETANPDHFKTGEIAKELNFVSHVVRSKLDEVKRRELSRLRALVKEQVERNGTELKDIKTPGHLDVFKDQFDEEDLKKLIMQTTSDLQAADEQRRKEFKEYEMQKEHDRREKLKSMDEKHKQEEERKFDEEKRKHAEHPQVHHPGSKAQLEEVWEETDGLPKEEFDPKTFFRLHDLNHDGVLDQGELEALFQKELDKVYDPKNPEDDMRERMEEMARMREHVMREIDTNRDGMISFDEWMAQVQRQEFNKDAGWDTLDKEPVFNENDLRAYEQQMANHDANYRYPPAHGGNAQQHVPGGPGNYQPNQAYNQYPPGPGQPTGYNPNPNQGYQQQHGQGYNQAGQGYNQYPGGLPDQYQQQPNYQNQGYQQQQQQYNNQGYNPGATPAPYGTRDNPSGYQQSRQQQQQGYNNQPGNQQYQQNNQYNQPGTSNVYSQPLPPGTYQQVPGQQQQQSQYTNPPVNSTPYSKENDPNSIRKH